MPITQEEFNILMANWIAENGGQYNSAHTGQQIDAAVTAVKNKEAVWDANSVNKPHLTVTSYPGSTVTCTKGSTVLTAEEADGVWEFDIPELGTWTVAAEFAGAKVTEQVNVPSVTLYKVELKPVHKFGYRIKKNDSVPTSRVEYLFDAVGMAPAKMDFATGRFDYGDWADVWFVKDNKPLMLKSDGTVDYYLDPGDYSVKESGEASDVANIDYDGNAMFAGGYCVTNAALKSETFPAPQQGPRARFPFRGPCSFSRLPFANLLFIFIKLHNFQG